MEKIALMGCSFLVPSDIDVAVVHPSAPSHLRRGMKPLGTAALKEKEKFDTYSQVSTRWSPFMLLF